MAAQPKEAFVVRQRNLHLGGERCPPSNNLLAGTLDLHDTAVGWLDEDQMTYFQTL